MAKFASIGASAFRVALIGATALTFTAAAAAQTRVGVTSATAGDPLGKPPALPQRILRVGIDVQANEAITTTADDRAHLLFLDGTSLTIGPNARVTIDKFIYDPDTKRGDLAITASKGVFRLVGGKISKTNAIVVTTSSATIGIRGGITIFSVEPSSTTSTFVFGNNMSVTAGGQTQIVTRPGVQVTTNAGGLPGLPTLVHQGGLSASLKQFEGRSGGASGSPGSGGGNNGGGVVGRNFDGSLQSSGFANVNSRQGPFETLLNGRPGSIVTAVVNNISTGVATNVNTNGNPNGGSNAGSNGNGNGGSNAASNGNSGGNGNSGNNGNRGSDNHGRHH